MKYLVDSMSSLAGQLNRLKKFVKSDELEAFISNFDGIMREVVDFIQKWLENWSCMCRLFWDESLTESVVPVKYILVATQMDKAIKLRGKIDDFTDRFITDVLSHIRVEQGLVSVPISIVQLVWFVIPDAIANFVANIQGGLSVTPG